MIDTGTKIVNLVDPSGRKYLRSTIVLEFAPKDLRYYTMSEEERLAFLETFKADVDTRLPVINDVVISLLGSQSFESVYTAQGKEDLRKAIMDRLNGMLTEYRVIYVYFTEFVVQ
jgi:flagellar FliL protein